MIRDENFEVDMQIAVLKKELKETKDENRALYARLEIVRQELDEATKGLEAAKKEIQEGQERMAEMKLTVGKYADMYSDIRDKYSSLMGKIMEMRDRMQQGLNGH